MRAGHDVLHQRGIGDAPHDRAVVQNGLERVVAVQRIAAEGRLVAEEAAGRRRDADRAAAVGAVGQRRHAGCDNRARAAGGATGGVVQVPRVARDAPEWAVGRAGMGKLGRRGALVHDGAGAQQPVHRRCCVVGAEVLEDLGAEGGDLALDRVEVLDRDRHAFQRAQPAIRPRVLGLGLHRLRPRPVEIVVGDGVERGIDRLRAGDLRVQQLHRRERARLEALQRLARGQIAKLQVRRCQDSPPAASPPRAPPGPAVPPA